MKKEMDSKERNYKIELTKLTDEDGGGFLATVPALPGCMSDGETLEEALANVKDAIKCWIETAEEIGRKIPKEEWYRSEDDYSGKLSLRIPKSLHKQVSDIANKEGCSINQLIMMYISMGVGFEYGKQQINITLNNPTTELPAIEEFQREKWRDYINLNNQSLVKLN